jgi:malonyl CoA-acyl carrier protein transacylase
LRDDLAFNMCRVVDWRGTVQSAYERGVRLQIELPPGAVLTGLARRVFDQGTVMPSTVRVWTPCRRCCERRSAATLNHATQASNNKNNFDDAL